MNDDLPVLDELEQSLIASCYGARTANGDPRRRSRARWTWAAAGLSAACAAAAVIAIALASGSVGVSAAQALDRAATAAAKTTTTALRPGQYWYTRSVYSMPVPVPIVPRSLPPGPPERLKVPPTITTEVRQSSETWIGVDGTIRQRTIALSQRFASPADRKRWRASGQPLPRMAASDSISAGDGWFPPQSGSPGDLGDGLFSHRQLVSLPTSVAQLRAAIDRARAALERRQQHGLSAQVGQGTGYARIQLATGPSAADARAIADLNAIVELLATPVTPGVRAALYRVAASLPGVTYDGPARDVLGRPGLAVSVGHGDGETTMIFSPRTGALLASSQGIEDPRGRSMGPLTDTIVAQGVASSIYSLPAGVSPAPGAVRAPQTISISPHRGVPASVFSLDLSAPAGTHAHTSAPSVTAVIDGPTAPGCRAYLMPTPLVQLAHGKITGPTEKRTYRYLLAPSSIHRRTWCPGRYLLQMLDSTNQSSLYFNVS